MVKKKICRIASIILILVVLMSIACPVYADKKIVVDQADVFTAEEASSLRKDAKAIGSKYSMDIVIVTTLDAEGKTSREYADDYFDSNGYGVSDTRDGILFLLDFDNREVYISTSGSAIRYLTDERIESILDDAFNSGLAEGYNYSATKAFLKSTGKFLDAGVPENQNSVAETATDTGVSAYTAKELLVDQAGLFSEAKKARLRDYANILSDRYKMDIVIVTTSDTGEKSLKDYAYDFYDSNGYGIGEKRDGILFLLNFDNREACIVTYGRGSMVLNYKGIEKVMEMVHDEGLDMGDPLGAANAFLEYTEKIFAGGVPVDEYNEANTVYFPLFDPDLLYINDPLTIAEVAISILIAGVIGFHFYSTTKEKYQGYPEPSEFDFRKNSFVNLEVIEDSLVNTYTTTRIIPRADPPSRSSSYSSSTHRSSSSSSSSHGGGGRSFSSGSSTHRSSSGSSHGGGGRRF